MNFWEAAFMAAMVTVTLIGFAANKILDVDFSVFFRRNWKSYHYLPIYCDRKWCCLWKYSVFQ